MRDPAAQGVPEDYPVYDLAQLARESLSYLQDIARIRVQSKGLPHVPQVEVLALERAPVQMRPNVFDRIIENLVVNSAEAEARKILIMVSCVDDQAYVMVLDDGPGFHPIILEGPKLGKSLKECGRGIGLAGVAVNVEQSGGTLELSNLEDGIGACVRMRFPLASLDALEQSEDELRQVVVRLMSQLTVLPEAAV